MEPGQPLRHGLAHGAGWGTTRPLVWGALGAATGLAFGVPGFGAALGFGGGALASPLGRNMPVFGSTWRQITKEEKLKRKIADAVGPMVTLGPESKVARELHRRATGGAPGRFDALDAIFGDADLATQFEELFDTPLTVAELDRISATYGRKMITRETRDGKLVQTLGHRSFGARSPTEHIKKGLGTYVREGLLSPLAWGVNAAFAVYDSSDNLFDPETGFNASLRRAVGAEAGWFLGGTMGAAALTAAIPFLGPLGWVGYIAGAVAGSMAGAEIADIPLGLANLGKKYGRHRKPFRSAFMDSEAAQTMRQRSMQAVHRSQMSARSAFGSEALSYHA